MNHLSIITYHYMYSVYYAIIEVNLGPDNEEVFVAIQSHVSSLIR